MLGSLRARYYVVVVGIATIPVLLLGLFTSFRSAQELERQSLLFQTELATRIEREIASFIASRINELRVLERTNVLSGMNRSQLSASLGRLLAHDKVYQSLYILSPDGQSRVFASRTDIAPQRPENWSAAPLSRPGFWRDNHFHVGEIVFDAELREPLIDISIPVLERRTGEVAYILLARARFRSIWSLLSGLDLPDGAEAFVVNSDGRVVAHRSPAEVLSERTVSFPAEGGRNVLPDGSTALLASQVLSFVDGPSRVVVTRSLPSALSQANEIRLATLISTFALLLGASVLALSLSRAIVRPVELLARSARQISQGNLDTMTTVSGPREIKDLSETLETMTSRLKQTIGDLERSEFAERQRSMVTLQSIGDAVITTDPDGTITFLNPVAERLTGWRLADAVNKPLSTVFRIVNETTREPAPDPVSRCLEDNEIVGLANQTVLLSRDGTEYSISDSAAPIREATGDVIGVVMVFRDVTERRELERTLRQSQKMEAIGQLSGGIAHDFNNLMQVIQGNAELLADDPDLDRALTNPILRATQRGAELTQRLLAFARKQPLLTRPVAVPDLLGDMLPMLDRVLGETIHVSLHVAGDVGRVQTDPGQLETAILNLAVNARDAMPDGGTLTLRCGPADATDFKERHEGALDVTDFVRVSVSDTGTGMDEETRTKAVDPFFTTKGVGEGSGLGLSMVYGFVMQTGGHLDIDSTKGVGTTVTMFLPLSEAPEPPSAPKATTEPARGDGELILVVEDDPDVGQFTKIMLENLGYRVVHATTVAAARDALAGSVRFSLVLTDVVLPGGESGLDVARELECLRPDLPVVLMSGYPVIQASQTGPDKHDFALLSKPFRRAELGAAVRSALAKKCGANPAK